MPRRLFQLGLVACFAGAGLAAAEARAHDPRNLDEYSTAQLQRDLEDELDDIYAELDDPDAEYNLDVLREDILDALGNGGDEGYESEIDLADLEAEMEEAETSLEDVVDEALARADELALRRRVQIHYASLGAATQRRDKATKATVAVRETVRGAILGIQRVKN